MIKITKWPAIVIANYRTGSSPFAYKLGVDNKVAAFIEPTITNERQQAFTDFLKTSQPYVVKFMPDQVDRLAHYQTLLESDCYKIKLQRKNKVEQIASYYLALVKGKWFTAEHEQESDYFIPVISEKIDYSIDKILSVDKLLDKITVVDQTIYFEDLPVFDDIDRKPSLKPKNLQRLYSLIESRL